MTTAENSGGGADRRVSRRSFLGYGAGAVGAAVVAGSPASAAFANRIATAASAPRPGGSIRIGISDYLSSDGLDPAQQDTTFGLMSGGMLHDTLLRLDEAWNVSPMLAIDWSVNKAATQYTYKLRNDVIFPSSGKKLDATDVAWTIAHVLNTKTASPGQSLFQPVLDPKGIVVVDPTTIRFELTKPDVFFPILLGFWYGRVSQANWDFSKGSGGTGPFKSVSFQGGQGFQFVRNPHYWMSGKPYLDAINGLVFPDQATKAEAVLSGDVNLIDQPQFDTLPLFQKSTTVTALENQYGAQMDFGIGSNAKPFSDPRVREAFKLMVDREALVKLSCAGQAVVGGDIPINPKDPWYPKSWAAPVYDPEKAKSLLKQAGYAGLKAPIYTSPSFLGLNDLSVQMQQMATAVGMDLSVVSLSTDAWEAHFLKSGIFANYWARQHPSTMMEFMAGTGGAWNEAKLHDPTIDKLLAQASATVNVATQHEIYDEIFTRYRNESATFWPVVFNYSAPHQKRLIGVQLQVTDLVDFRGASVT